MRWFERLQSWIRTIVDSRPPLVMERVDDLPDKVLPGFLYLIGEGKRPWLAKFTCPCGCSNPVSLSLLRDDSPRWRAHVHANGTVTLAPSIWRTKGCQSHFFVRKGKVVWVTSLPRRR